MNFLMGSGLVAAGFASGVVAMLLLFGWLVEERDDEAYVAGAWRALADEETIRPGDCFGEAA